MTIGEFSRRSQLSLKALRLYERLGLLRPAAVDQRNGYRRYHESQLYTARLIVMLRLLDMPLPEVGKVVSASRTEAAEIIGSYWASAESRFAAQRQVMDTLRSGVAASEMPAQELPVRERDVAAQTVLTEQRHVYIGQLAWTREAAARLAASAARCGGAAGERFVVFHGMVTTDSDGPVEVCVPVSHPPEEPAELAWRVEPAHREAFIPVTKTHFEVPAIFSVYDQLARWVTAPGRRRAGAPREVYRAGIEPLFATAGQQICDVAVPFASCRQPGSQRAALLRWCPWTTTTSLAMSLLPTGCRGCGDKRGRCHLHNPGKPGGFSGPPPTGPWPAAPGTGSSLAPKTYCPAARGVIRRSRRGDPRDAVPLGLASVRT